MGRYTNYREDDLTDAMERERADVLAWLDAYYPDLTDLRREISEHWHIDAWMVRLPTEKRPLGAPSPPNGDGR